ncbi:MAG: transglycosylase domain-containing protein [Actinomycetota bacterium]|nr:transglycosylase domain-containing protein [Actinomycetota bacterium]
MQVEAVALRAKPAPNAEQTLVYAADGSVIATLRVQNRVIIGRDDVPQVLIDAVLGAEDRRFYRHDGIDLRAIARAAIANQRAGTVVQGGSTITQQLVKNRYFPDAPQTLRRKSVEVRLALRVERERSKDEILVDYLNTIYLGEGTYGVQAAARHYFGIDAAGLRLPQAALLAGLIRSPENYSPYGHPRAAHAARRRALAGMIATGAIGPRRARWAAGRSLGVRARSAPATTRYPYFVEYVKRVLLANPALGADEASRVRALYRGGLRIHTTIDPDLQAKAEAAASAHLPDGADPEVAIAVVRPGSGRVVAAVSGRNFRRLQFDLATQAHRQPGSAFKTFALVAALRGGMRLDDVVDSGSATLLGSDGHDPWSVSSTTVGQLPLDRALALSSNGAFARLAVELGGARIAEQARAMGVTSDIGSNDAIVLGGLRGGVTPLEMASAYATLANTGIHVPPTPITKVTDADGKLLWRPAADPRVAVDPENAYLTTEALQGVVESGTGQAAGLARPAAGKTGTTQGYRDAWFVGFTPQLAAAVWVGHPRPRPMYGVRGVSRVEGGTFPARIWRSFMTAALADRPVRPFPYPSRLALTVRVDPASGLLVAPWCGPGVTLTALPKQLPTSQCPQPPPPPAPAPRPAPAPTRAPTEPAPEASEAGSEPAPKAPADPPSPAPDASEPSVRPRARPSPSPTPSPRPSPSPKG